MLPRIMWNSQGPGVRFNWLGPGQLASVGNDAMVQFSSELSNLGSVWVKLVNLLEGKVITVKKSVREFARGRHKEWRQTLEKMCGKVNTVGRSQWSRHNEFTLSWEWPDQRISRQACEPVPYPPNSAGNSGQRRSRSVFP